MFVFGEAVGFDNQGLFKLVIGVQTYELPPLAVNIVDAPKQMVVLPEIEIFGIAVIEKLTLLMSKTFGLRTSLTRSR